MQTTKTLNSFSQLNPAVISKSFTPQYRPRFQKKEFFLNELQKRDYNRLLHALRGYTPEEVCAMDEEQKRSIIYTTNLAWTLINRLKQQRLNQFLGKILGKVFGKDLCGNMVPFLLAPIVDNTFQVNQDIKEVNVPVEAIVREFIAKKLLPANFLAA